MNENFPFQVIPGGLSESSATSRKEFLSAVVTDTRMMGVVCVSARWKLPDNQVSRYLYQYFYIDADEFGLESYEQVYTCDPADEEDLALIHSIEARLMGGLGGDNIQISERELRALVQKYILYNQKKHVEMPEGIENFEFLLQPRIELSDTEEYVLMCKQCPIMKNPYQVINYFIMRCFCKDFEAAKFLTKNYVRTELFSDLSYATLFRNTITEAEDPGSGVNTDYYVTDNDRTFGTFTTRRSFLCESLLEVDEHYYITVTQVTLEHLKVVKYERISSFQISKEEFGMILSRSEFITVYECMEEHPDFTRETTALSDRATITEYEGGTLFMIFRPHNDHVAQPVFNLNDDVLGIYYITDFNQILACAFDRESIQLLEKDFSTSALAAVSFPSAKYEFKSPVLFDFVSSGIEDFEDFVNLIAKTPHEKKGFDELLNPEFPEDDD